MKNIKVETLYTVCSRSGIMKSLIAVLMRNFDFKNHNIHNQTEPHQDWASFTPLTRASTVHCMLSAARIRAMVEVGRKQKTTNCNWILYLYLDYKWTWLCLEWIMGILKIVNAVPGISAYQICWMCGCVRWWLGLGHGPGWLIYFTSYERNNGYIDWGPVIFSWTRTRTRTKIIVPSFTRTRTRTKIFERTRIELERKLI